MRIFSDSISSITTLAERSTLTEPPILELAEPPLAESMTAEPTILELTREPPLAESMTAEPNILELTTLVEPLVESTIAEPTILELAESQGPSSCAASSAETAVAATFIQLPDTPNISSSTNSFSSAMLSPFSTSHDLALKDSQSLQVQELDFESLGLISQSLISECTTELSVSVPAGTSVPSILSPHSGKSWRLNYTMLTFMINGQLFAEYHRIASMLGLPCSSDTHWQTTISWLGSHVEKLAEWSCEQVREKIVKRGDKDKWVASYDGFYLTRGHYSNNSSATLHDYSSGSIAWFEHRTKRGLGHTWEGTSAGAESDMYNVILGKVKTAGFNIIDMVVDKDSSMNSIYCTHFPEGNITYCSNHSAKTLHKDLQKVKQLKCEVR